MLENRQAPPMTLEPTSREHNQLLAALPPADWRRLRRQLELVELPAGALLYEAGSVLRHVHFPTTAIVSLMSSMSDGEGAEVAAVGNEGVVGVCAFMGGGAALSSAVVQKAGHGWRISARGIADEARDSEAVMQQLLRYTQALFAEMAQTSACHRLHALDQQLCRWLLQHMDRLGDTDMHVTQERIAGMLGVRREGVTVGTQKLLKAGLIRTARGRISVLDRDGLEQRSCECYGVMRQAYERLLSGSEPWPVAVGA
jgi:CRP-like cAMP-binding protein